MRDLRLLVAELPRRAWLTLREFGLRTFLFRVLTFPLRLTPLGRRLGLGPRMSDRRAHARGWYRRHWRPVTIVIPTYGAPDMTIEAVSSLRRTVDPRRARILVVDDASAPEHRDRLRELDGIELVVGEETVGFAANCNRGMRLADGDVVLLNSDVIAHDDWLECLQWAAYMEPDIGIVGPRLLYPDGTIQSAGSQRNLGAPEWFDHRYRFVPGDHGPANSPAPALAMTGACLYVRRDAIDRLGLLDEAYGMAYEDVDWCLRAWHAGLRVEYEPAAVLTHLESKTRGTEQGERELAAQRRFWEIWGDSFERRHVRDAEGRLRIVYVTEDTGVGGGHRVVFEHLNRLHARGHRAELWSLDGPPDWFPLHVPVRRFESYGELGVELAHEDAIKVATWWNTAATVFRASMARGIPVYFVQDFETSYYPEDPIVQHGVVASYRQEFRYLTTSNWVRERLAEVGQDAAIVAPGIDLDTFHRLELPRDERAVLALGRSNPLKNFPLTMDAWDALPEPRPALWLFGIEPELVGRDNGVRYVTAPSDAEVNELLNTAAVFLQTSRHEGFCLPLLEAMATGTPVVCTDAHGNRDYCRDGSNCLIAEPRPQAVAAAVQRLLDDEALRRRLAENGLQTAESYGWERRIDELERFFEDVAG